MTDERRGGPARIRNWGAWAILAAALAAGLYARLDGFGTRQLAVDEFYFAESVDHILERGAPVFEDGGYYLQGLIPQYLTAASVKAFGETNLALRLPALLFGMLAPLLAYRYARRYLPASLALLVSAALLASSWEVEFSRFARMYTALQCATLAFLYRYDRSMLGPEWRRRYWAHTWVVAAVLCHFEGAILAPLLFVPLIEWNDRGRFLDRGAALRYLLLTCLVTAAVGALATFDFRRWGAADPFPAGYAPPSFSPLRAPQYVLWDPHAPPLLALGVTLGLLVGACIVGAVLVRRRALESPAAGLLPVVAAAAAHQAAAAGLIAAVLALRCGVRGAFWETRACRLLLGAAGALFLLWALIGLGAGDWAAASGAAGWPGALRRTFASWPNCLDGSIRPWATDLPILGTLGVLSLGFLLVRKVRASWLDLLRGPEGFLAYGLIVFGLLAYYYDAMRYFFLFYPAVWATVAAAALRLVGPSRGILVFCAAFALSGDFDPRHLAAAGGEGAAFRTGPFESKASLWYPRLDYRGVADHLREVAAAEPGSLFIVVNSPPLGRLFDDLNYASYLARDSFVFYEWSRNRGSRDVWKNRLLLSEPSEVRDAALPYKTVRLVRPLSFASTLEPRLVWGERLQGVDQEFVSGDGRIEVLMVRLRAPQVGSIGAAALQR